MSLVVWPSQHWAWVWPWWLVKHETECWLLPGSCSAKHTALWVCDTADIKQLISMWTLGASFPESPCQYLGNTWPLWCWAVTRTHDPSEFWVTPRPYRIWKPVPFLKRIMRLNLWTRQAVNIQKIQNVVVHCSTQHLSFSLFLYTARRVKVASTWYKPLLQCQSTLFSLS